MPSDSQHKYCFICGRVSINTEIKAISVFGCPKDKLESWQAVIPKAGLEYKHRLCSIHFDEEDILKGRTIQNVFYPYKWWTLCKNAVPKHCLTLEHQTIKQHKSPTASKTGENNKGSNEKSKKKTNQPNTLNKRRDYANQSGSTFQSLLDFQNHDQSKENEPNELLHENTSIKQTEPGPDDIPIDTYAISTSECIDNILPGTDNPLHQPEISSTNGNYDHFFKGDTEIRRLIQDTDQNSTENPSSCGLTLVHYAASNNVLSVEMTDNTQHPPMTLDEPLDSSASASQSIESAYRLDHQQSGNQSSKATDHSHNGADVGVDMNVGQCVNCYFVEKRNQELKKIVNKKMERIDTLERKLQLAQQKIQRLQSAKTAKSNLVTDVA